MQNSQDVPARRQDTLELFGVTHVEEDQGMKVAVSGVENVADNQVVFLGDIPDMPHHGGYLTARHHTVLGVVRRADAAERRKCHLASLP